MFNQMIQRHTTTPQRDNMPRTSRDDVKKLIRLYMKMFVALTHQSLLTGKTLGAAWHHAVRQMEIYINGRDKFNPVTKQLSEILNTHRTIVAKHSMTHKYKDSVAKLTPAQREMVQKNIVKNMQSSGTGINKITAKYQPVATKMRDAIAKLNAVSAKLSPVQKKPVQNKIPTPMDAATIKKMQQILLLQRAQKQHVRAA